MHDSAITVNILLKKKDSLWIAHCLEMDIVATSTRQRDVIKDMADLLVAQVQYAFDNNNLEYLFHPAPIEVWEEMRACKALKEKRINIKKHIKNGAAKVLAVMPKEIVTNTCTPIACPA